ncbi:unnamed protein product, partial [Sphagnum balticum]
YLALGGTYPSSYGRFFSKKNHSFGIQNKHIIDGNRGSDDLIGSYRTCPHRRNHTREDCRAHFHAHSIPRVSWDFARSGDTLSVYYSRYLEFEPFVATQNLPTSIHSILAAQKATGNTREEDQNTVEQSAMIEDALKLYQTALKLHSQGPALYDQAAAAYTNLLKSEIFKYPESQTEFERLCKHPELELGDVGFALGLDLPVGAEAPPSTLPQILYLSYKNHGQFILDRLKHHMKTESYSKSYLDNSGKMAIGNFTLALASDESDTELWRRAARIAAMLRSRRISRYCLEAAVEVDDDPTVTEIEPPSLEEGFAGEQLKEQLEVLGDDTSLSHPIMAPYLKKTMPQFLTQHMDPFTFLPNEIKSLSPTIQPDAPHPSESRILMDIEQRTWTAVGHKLFSNYISPYGLSGTGVVLRLPLETLSPAELGAVEPPASVEDQIMKDAGTTESPAAESAEAATTTPDDEPVEIVTTTTTVPLSDEQGQSSIALPTRKRSQSTAGIRETPEEDSSTQKRSKRIRNRDSTLDGTNDPSAQFAEQLAGFMRADEGVFTFVGDLLTKLGVDDLGTLSSLRTALSAEELGDREDVLANTASRDLRDILRTWDDTKASTFINCN